MTEQQLELLSAFFDGEAVHPTALADVLDDPGAIEALREFARLRHEVASAQIAPRPGWVTATRAKLTTKPTRSLWGPWVPVPVAAFAAAVVIVAVAGLWGARFARPPRDSAMDRPPEATRTIAFELGKDWHQQSATR